ncbi:hypothetical protein SALBM135S_01512 [Streptomyces alboniger]
MTTSGAPTGRVTTSGAPTTAGGLPRRLTGLVATLRSHGLRIGPGETVDAAEALRALGLDNRELVREGLAAALLHQQSQRAVFDPVFDLYFPSGVGGPEGDGDRDTAPDREALRERLVAALAADNRALLGRLALQAVDGFGGYGASGGSDGWSSYQTLERLRPETLLARVLAARRAGSGGDAAFTDRLEADEVRRRIEDFRERVRSEARRRVAERRGTEEIARRAVATTADRIDFLLAGRAQLDELRRTVHPLARRLATRLAARRRRAAHGSIDLRRTRGPAAHVVPRARPAHFGGEQHDVPGEVQGQHDQRHRAQDLVPDTGELRGGQELRPGERRDREGAARHPLVPRPLPHLGEVEPGEGGHVQREAEAEEREGDAGEPPRGQRDGEGGA